MKEHAWCWIALLITFVLSDGNHSVKFKYGSSKQPIVIPLEMVNFKPYKPTQWDRFNNYLQNIKSNFQKEKSTLETRDLTKICMENKPYIKPMYDFSVGSSPNPFRILFDTGSVIMWITSHHACKPTYRASRNGIALNIDFKETYIQKDSVLGSIWADRISIAELEVENQFFGVGNQFEGFEDDIPFDGILGMPSIDHQIFVIPPSKIDGKMSENKDESSERPYIEAPTLLKSLFDKRLIPEYCFGYFFSRTTHGSELYLGGYDMKRAINPEFHELEEGPLWKISLKNIKVNNDILYYKDAVIDTGAVFISTPMRDAKIFYRSITGQRESDRKGIYLFPCQAPLAVSFKFQKVEYHIPKDDLIMQEDFRLFGSNICTGGLRGKEGLRFNRWVLGIAFLKNVYTIFDVATRMIGFTALTLPSSMQKKPVN